MATQTKTLWTAFDPVSGNGADIQMSYDDVSMRIISFTAHNPTSKTISFSATSNGNGKNYGGTVQPDTAELTIAMTAGTQNRLDITVTPSGKLDGVEYRINYG